MPYMAVSQYCVKHKLWLNAIMPQTQDKFIARLPEGLRERLKTAANRNKRSMNAELVHALELHLETEEYHGELDAARELKNPNIQAYKALDFPGSSMPATRGDLDRLLIAFQAELDKKVGSDQ